MSEQPRRNRIQVEMPTNLKASYANLAIIAHTASEFFVDFAQLLPGLPKSQVHTRIVMTPTHAKLLYRALEENISRYEGQHGAIEVPPTMAEQLTNQLFSSVRPPETRNGDGDNDDQP